MSTAEKIKRRKGEGNNGERIGKEWGKNGERIGKRGGTEGTQIREAPQTIHRKYVYLAEAKEIV